jgi:O-antigen/teichoic acid export membrane protein
MGDVWVLLTVLALAIFSLLSYPPGYGSRRLVWVIWALSAFVLAVLVGMTWQVYTTRRGFEREMRSLQDKMDALLKSREEHLQ